MSFVKKVAQSILNFEQYSKPISKKNAPMSIIGTN